MRYPLPNSRLAMLIAVALGAFSVVGFAPFYLYPVPIIALAWLFHYWSKCETAKQAAWLGYAFGLGLFTAGIPWIYISLHDFGGMPLPMAAFSTLVLCAFLSLSAAGAGLASKKIPAPLIAVPMLWVLFEWIRNWIFTGFPWLILGYSQVPYSPLAGVAPVFGVYGMSLVTAFTASLLAQLAEKPMRRSVLMALITLWIAGSFLKLIEWSKPIGAPISIALIQGNIAQDMKWQPEVAQHTLDSYLHLAQQSGAQLTVLPETALPMLIKEVPADYLNQLKTLAQQNHGDLLVGAVELENDQYYNSMLSFGSAPTQTYRKSHLVPFGEFIPLKGIFGWIYRDWLNIPLTDLARGGVDQKPLQIAGQQVAVNICYEDVFGEEIIRQLPQATLLVNASNDAWYGESLAADQHLQISQTRALETGRMMLRATNTGATAIIGTKGEVLAHAPHFTNTIIKGEAQGYTGATPYVRWGNWPVIIFCLAVLALLWGRKKK